MLAGYVARDGSTLANLAASLLIAGFCLVEGATEGVSGGCDDGGEGSAPELRQP